MNKIKKFMIEAPASVILLIGMAIGFGIWWIIGFLEYIDWLANVPKV